MFEALVSAFIVYFVTVDPFGNVPVYLAVTQGLNRRQKLRAVIEGVLVAALVLVVFATLGSSILGYLNISITAFKIAGGLILLLLALDMLADRRQARRERHTELSDEASQSVGVYPLGVPLLAGPSAITSVMLITGDLIQDPTFSAWSAVFASLVIILIVMVISLVVLSAAAVAGTLVPDKLMQVFSRIIAILLAALSIQFMIDGLTELSLIPAI